MKESIFLYLYYNQIEYKLSKSIYPTIKLIYLSWFFKILEYILLNSEALYNINRDSQIHRNNYPNIYIYIYIYIVQIMNTQFSFFFYYCSSRRIDLALNNLQRLICHKTNQTNHETKQLFYSLKPSPSRDFRYTSLQLHFRDNLKSATSRMYPHTYAY